MTYVPALDGLRGISLPGTIYTHFQIFLSALPTAPAWVMHSGPVTLNIEMFFVLSGALITSLLVSEHQRTGTVALDKFYLRRSRRLGPAWTLGIEEQFYLTWPVLLRAALRRAWDRQEVLLACALVIVIFTAISTLLDATYQPTHVVYMTPTQISPILIGCVLGYTITANPGGWLAALLRSRIVALAGLGGMVLISIEWDANLTALAEGGYALYGVAASHMIALDAVLITAISGIFYYLVERPIRRRGWRNAFRRSATAPGW